MKKILLLAVTLTAFTSVAANALDEGNIFDFFVNREIQKETNLLEQRVSKPAVTTTDALNALADLRNQAAAIDNNVQKSFLNIVSQLSSSQDSAAMQNQLNAVLNAGYSRDDAAEIMADILQSYAKNISSNKSDVIATLQNMSDSEQAKFLKSLNEMSNQVQQYINLTRKGVATVQNVARAAQKANDTIQILRSVNQTASEIKNTTKSVLTLTNQLYSVARTAGLLY